jgi:hypothetical protein
MAVQFTFHNDDVDYDMANGSPLTAEEAQVIATLRLAEAVEEVKSTLKDALLLAEKELDRLAPL